MNKLDFTIGMIIVFSIIIIIIVKLLEKCNNSINKEIKEKFIVSDAQDFHNYYKLREKVLLESNTFDDEKELIGPQPEKPYEDSPKVIDNKDNKDNKDNINDDRNYNSYISTIESGIDSPPPLVKCGNSSIQNRYTTGHDKLKPFAVTCPYPDGVNNYTYFKKFYNAPPIPLEDYTVRGANYYEYSDNVNPDKLNVRILSHNTKGLPLKEMKYKNIPEGYNYAFQNTPAMRV